MATHTTGVCTDTPTPTLTSIPPTTSSPLVPPSPFSQKSHSHFLVLLILIIILTSKGRYCRGSCSRRREADQPSSLPLPLPLFLFPRRGNAKIDRAGARRSILLGRHFVVASGPAGREMSVVAETPLSTMPHLHTTLSSQHTPTP